MGYEGELKVKTVRVTTVLYNKIVKLMQKEGLSSRSDTIAFLYGIYDALEKKFAPTDPLINLQAWMTARDGTQWWFDLPMEMYVDLWAVYKRPWSKKEKIAYMKSKGKWEE